MPTENLTLRTDFSDAIAALAQASEAIQSLSSREPVTTKTRVIVKMAKNLQHGEMVEIPGREGWHKVTGWTLWPDRCLIGCPDNVLYPFDPHERVRVLREVTA